MKTSRKSLMETWTPLVVLAMFLASLGLACQPSISAQQPAGTPGATTAPAATTPASPAGTASAASPAPAGTSSAVSPAPAGTAAGDFSTAVRQVSQSVKPAVVQITNEQVQANQFNQPFSVPAGVGSGIIYDNQGHVLTNNHVVEGAQQLLVALPDGRSFQGKLIGADTLTDLAVLQIGDGNLPVAPLGDSTKMQVGDWVVAIGNALALEGGPTVTVGVVSATNRAVQEPASSAGAAQGPFLFDLIQTDAPINPGNSGGPLVNLSGQVIGISTLVAGQAEPGVPAQGIGFAISVNTAKSIADELVANGRAVHPFLGISYVPLNSAIAARLRISQTQGALVSSVVRGSPAASAGVQAQDVITAIDNTALKTDSDLAQTIDKHKPGDTVTLSIIRGGQQTSVKVTLGERPAQ